MSRRGVWLACLIVVLLLLAALPASALPASASGVRIVRLSVAQGDVQIDRNTGQGWEQAILNMPVIGGARVYAGENSKAELEFEDGSSVRLVGPAQVSVTELSTKPDGSPVNAIQIDSGVVYVNARLADHADFRISDNSGGSFAITKPSHLRFTVSEQTASVAVTDGEVVAEDANPSTTVRSGETYNYLLGQPASAVRMNAVSAQPGDVWDQQRDNYDEHNAAAGIPEGAENPDNAYAYAPGVADLGNYGTYADVPGCGDDCWQPNGVDAEWDPFDDGAWSYYPDWGWTFVSAYPWGWTPFYYGNWCYVGGRGWWWRPGPLHGHGLGGWHARPQLAGTPHGFRTPHPPAGSGHGTVAVAGSHLLAGPIDATHGSHGFAANGLARGGTVHASTASRAGISQAGASSIRESPAVRQSPAVRESAARSNTPGFSITGRKGSYRVTGLGSGRNGYELGRAPGVAAASRGYAYGASRGYPAPHFNTAPRAYSAPHFNTSQRAYPAPMERAPVSPPVSFAARSFSGGGGSFHASGGGFQGGGFHGGGGGAHVGGGHR